MRRVRLRRAVEGGLYEHAQPYIRAALMMGVFSCICSGVLWGRVGLQCRILGGVIVSFLGGTGEGKRNSRARNAETMRRCFAGRCEFRTAPVCMLYIICWAAEVSLQHASGHLEKCPRPRCPGQRTCAVQASTTRRPVYASIYVKGLLLLVPPPRSCVYVAYAHAFYVVMCYMSITCICQLYVLKC